MFFLYMEKDTLQEIVNDLKYKRDALALAHQALKMENDKLRKLINESINSNEILAKILIDKESPFLRSIILNRGSKDNVVLGMAVLDGGYLIGKIIEVNYSTSRALLVSDLNSKIPVSIEPGNIQSILSGTGKDKGIIEFMHKKKKIEDQSIIYSSGSGGIFKAGIPIGTITTNDNDSEKSVNFFSDLSQLTFVKLISFKREKN